MLDQNAVTTMVLGAYKKLRSYYYYDKSLLYIKKRIALFESNESEPFEQALKDLAENLSKNSQSYFAGLIKKIDLKILPKKLNSIKPSTGVIQGSLDHSKDVETLNFYIDPPVELLTIDFLWTLLLAKIAHSRSLLGNQHSYAGHFKKSLFNDNNDLLSGVDFESNRCFEPYFFSYSKWRKNAFNVIDKYHKNEDLLLISLDIKSFYYSVDFKFEMLKNMLQDDERLHELEPLTEIIAQMYLSHTKKVRYFRNCQLSENGKSSIFPIGLLSPVLLRELYLSEFDKNLPAKTSALYYGRYVDDILLVVNAHDMENSKRKNCIEQKLVATDVIRPVKPAKALEYSFNGFPNLKVQQDKINCFFFDKSQQNILYDVYKKNILISPSEPNLLPDSDLLSKGFSESAYVIDNLDRSDKVRDLGLLESNYFRAIRHIWHLIWVLKNTYTLAADTSGKAIDLNRNFDELLEFFRGSQSISYFNAWKAVFELFVISNDKDRANRFYLMVKKCIEVLTFDNLRANEIGMGREPASNARRKAGKRSRAAKRDMALKKMKKCLGEHLDIAISLAVALDLDMGKNKKHKESARSFRTANLLNHNLMAFPLLNYSNTCIHGNPSLIACNLSQYIDNGDRKHSNPFKLDEFRLKWTPRYIYLNEFYICYFLFYFDGEHQLDHDKKEHIYEKFSYYNNLDMYNFGDPIKYTSIKTESTVNNSLPLRIFKVPNRRFHKIRIGIVNTKLEERKCMDCLDEPRLLLTLEAKRRLFKILEIAKNEKTNLLVFPEFYMPAVWLNDVARFAQACNITIVTGLHYLKCQNQAYNFTAIIKPFGLHFKSCAVFFRQKNFYAPVEKIEIARRGFTCQDANDPYYIIINDDSFRLGTILCFEFTDISSRAALKSQIDILAVPQFNKDTHYFSSLVESTARDLHCFVIQANTSVYGDSRITAPFKNDFKNIVQLKGGANDIVIIGDIDMSEFHMFQKNYFGNREQTIARCLKCRKVKPYVAKGDRFKSCDNCRFKEKSNKIKNLPPNFNSIDRRRG
jgi:predicted amidohydrolase